MGRAAAGTEGVFAVGCIEADESPALRVVDVSAEPVCSSRVPSFWSSGWAKSASWSTGAGSAGASCDFEMGSGGREPGRTRVGAVDCGPGQ